MLPLPNPYQSINQSCYKVLKPLAIPALWDILPRDFLNLVMEGLEAVLHDTLALRPLLGEFD